MADSCRAAISNWWKNDHPSGANAGLLRDRYLRVAVKDKANHPGARRDLFDAMRQSTAQSEEVYQVAYLRHLASLEASFLQKPNAEGFFQTKGRMIIGLGGENVLETGLTLHHTYGTPMIPGSALKGLAAHYCDQVWGKSDDKDRDKFKLGEEYHKTIFGTTEDSGHIIFHDAWILPECLIDSLQPDVMTPHHGDYYSKKEGAAPTDFDDPNPVTFISIVGIFHVIVSCDVAGEDGKKWAKLAFDLLTQALKEWGIGGKTNAGYGRLARLGQEEKSESSPEGAKQGTASSASGPGQQAAQKQKATVKRLKHNKGETVEVTRVADPKPKRNAAYFMADDGFCGMVVQGTAPSVEIGKKTRLVISGVMEKEGLYNFAAPSANKNPGRQRKDRWERR